METLFLKNKNLNVENESEVELAGPSTQGQSISAVGSEIVTNGHLVEIFRKRLTQEEEIKECLSLLQDYDPEKIENIQELIRTLKNHFNQKWNKYRRTELVFKKLA
jgi:hypothetical protein